MKNGFPAPNKELQQTKNDHLTGKAPYKFESAFLQRRVINEPVLARGLPTKPQILSASAKPDAPALHNNAQTEKIRRSAVRSLSLAGADRCRTTSCWRRNAISASRAAFPIEYDPGLWNRGKPRAIVHIDHVLA